MGSIFGKAKRGFGKALKPRGPGVIRPKPTDRYGQQMKPKTIRPGKKDGGMLKAGSNGKKKSFGMLSVKAGIDKNPNPTQADRIAGAKMKNKGKKA